MDTTTFMATKIWLVLWLNRAYVGPAIDTPDFRRITPKKRRDLTQEQLAANQEINHFRVPVEQFFGYLVQSWVIPRGKYK
jgi:hypothetical protein